MVTRDGAPARYGDLIRLYAMATNFLLVIRAAVKLDLAGGQHGAHGRRCDDIRASGKV